MIGRQPDGSLVSVRDSCTNTAGPLLHITASDRPLWNTDPISSGTAPTLEEYREACRKIRELSKKFVGPYSTWKTVLDLLPKE